MDQFTVPQFIEHKPKVIGPLTFRQFVYIGIAGAGCIFFYFILPFYFFTLAAMIIMLGGAGMAFGKASGRSLPEMLKSFLFFSFSPKIYLWKKKVGPPPKFLEKPAPQPKEIKVGPVPTMVGKSRLKELLNQVETRTK